VPVRRQQRRQIGLRQLHGLMPVAVSVYPIPYNMYSYCRQAFEAVLLLRKATYTCAVIPRVLNLVLVTGTPHAVVQSYARTVKR